MNQPCTSSLCCLSHRNVIAPALALLLFGCGGEVLGQGTVFSYQGRLSDGNNPATGTYDLRLTIYDAVAGGSIVAGPLTNLATLVNDGLFFVTLDVGSGVFTGTPRWMELGVRTNGGLGFTALAPRQQILAAPYAITAGNVTGPIDGNSILNGTITSSQLAEGAVTPASLASHSITAEQLANGAAAANLGTSGQSGVPTGALILSTNSSDANLLNAGYLKLGKVDLGDFWQTRHSGGPETPGGGQTAVWTGTEMIVWGGNPERNDGGRYNPTVNTWAAVTTNDAPIGRFNHTAVWTGTEMIVWGGVDSEDSPGALKDGGCYNPLSNNWAAVATNDAPSARSSHTAVWTGSEMIIWGGDGATGFLNDGGRYNPASNTWSSVNTNGAPRATFGHTAVWTGTEMIVWGADGGGRYNPVANTWGPVKTNGAPTRRMNHTAVWTGTEMIVWGGDVPLGNGGRYNPVADDWEDISTSGAPDAREHHTAVWTGVEMIVWGGLGPGYSAGPEGGRYLGNGARYNPAADSWAPVTINDAPTARSLHTAVWTGSQMIVWGGAPGPSTVPFAYTTARLHYLYQSP